MTGHLVGFVMQRRIYSVLLPLGALVLAVLVAGYGNQWRGEEVRPADLQARQDGARLLLIFAGLTALWLPGEVRRYRAGLRAEETHAATAPPMQTQPAEDQAGPAPEPCSPPGRSLLVYDFSCPRCRASYYLGVQCGRPWIGCPACGCEFQIPPFAPMRLRGGPPSARMEQFLYRSKN
jgi:hypothetical protein